MPSTEELVNATQAGDVSAFEELVRRYQGTAVVTAWSLNGDFHSAQDVTQDAFVIAFRKLSQLRDAKTFGPWLLSIVKREAQRSKQAIDRRSEVSLVSEFANRDDRWWQDFQDLLPELRKLPEHERVVVSLRFVDGLSVNEIAEATERPVGTVTKQLSRALERLRSFMTEVEK